MNVSGQRKTRPRPGVSTPFRAPGRHARVNVVPGTRGISRSAAIPPSRFATAANGRTEARELTSHAVRVRATSRSQRGSQPIA